jgi:uncharacterized protein
VIAEVAQRRPELARLCQRFGVRRLEVFGSAASGAIRAESDLDFLVDFDAVTTGLGYADRYFGLLEALEQLFGRRVDLVVTSAIKNPYFLESVDRTKDLVYAP